MTAVIENDQAEAPTESEASEAPKKRGPKPGTKRERNLNAVSELHSDLAAFINTNPEFIAAGIDSVTPEQVRAVLLLRSDFGNTPEALQKREARKAARTQNKKKYEGLTEEQIKAVKEAERAEKQAEKLRARLADVEAKALAIRSEATASGADLVAASVESDQSDAAADKPKRRGFGRNRSE